MAVTGNTELGATKQDVVSALVSRLLIPKVNLLPTVTDVSVFAKRGMKSVSFPKAGKFTAALRPSATAGTPQTAAFATDKLDLDKPAYISFIVDDNDAYQSSVDVKSAYIERSVEGHAEFVDQQILSILDTASGYQQAAGIDQTKILNARKWLLKNKARLNDLTMLVNCDDESLLLAIPEFVRADAYGSSNIPSGVVGKIYGINVKLHQDETITKSFIYSKEAIAFALQKGAAYGEETDIDYGVGTLKVAIDQLFGLKAMRLTEGLDSAGVALAAGKSPFIAEIG